jgi:hypothetical protein
MRYIILICAFIVFGVAVFVSCKKYKDPAPKTDPRLTTHYCNDPIAANYNVGFPGIPDNTLCVYPRDLFVGTYIYHDSVWIEPKDIYVFADSFILTISAVPNSLVKILVSGFCKSGGTFSMTAGPTYVATVDSIVGDTTTLYQGQFLCRTLDTLSGTITKDKVDSTLLHMSLQVVSDTGITMHYGSAVKQ